MSTYELPTVPLLTTPKPTIGRVRQIVPLPWKPSQKLDLCIDAGSQDCYIATPACKDNGQGGIIVHETSAFITEKNNPNHVLCVGNKAKTQRGLVELEQYHTPVVEGGLIDAEAFKILLRSFIRSIRLQGNVTFGTVLTAVPLNVSTLQREALRKIVIEETQADRVEIIWQPMCSAISQGHDPSEPTCFTATGDMGAGTFDVSFALGSILLPGSTSITIGGDKIDQALAYHLRYEMGIEVDLNEAERIKKEMPNTDEPLNGRRFSVTGKRFASGEDEESATFNLALIHASTMEFTVEDYDAALVTIFGTLHARFLEVLSGKAGGFYTKLLDKSLILTGGGAFLRGLKALLMTLGFPVKEAENASTAVVDGQMRLLLNPKWIDLVAIPVPPVKPTGFFGLGKKKNK